MTVNEKIYHLFIQYPKISTDTRNIAKSSIFFALKGENFNGNKFASEALNNGAAYAIVDEEEYANSERIILVDHVLETLTELARMYRKKMRIPILAITGTNGKTTTKELISNVLAQQYNVSYTQGNLNNHIGVPLTLLSMDSNTEFGVVEMGANHPGEIADLCKIADPDYGIITNIGKAHLEGFGSFQGVINTKSELFNFIKDKKGIFFYNNDNPLLDKIAGNYSNKITFGNSKGKFNGELIQSPPFVHVKVIFPKGVLYLHTNLIGAYNFENIMAAACIGNHFKIDPLKIQKALKEYQPQNNRSQLINKGDLRIIMDAYNANPSSMQTSIESFLSNSSEMNNYLILGDMLELGDYSKEEHNSILKIVKNYKPTDVFLVGPLFSELGQNFGFKSFANTDELNSYLQINPIKNGNLLIKGSRGIQLEKVLEYLS